jgi:hypothetical protein
VEGGIPAVLVYEDLEFLTPYMHTADDVVGTSLNDLDLFEANARLAAAAMATLAGSWGGNEGTFRRADGNADERVDLSDAVHVLLYLFGKGPAPSCLDAADADDSGVVGLGDAVTVLAWLFAGGPAAPAPGRACGPDPTEDLLPCASYGPCFSGR